MNLADIRKKAQQERKNSGEIAPAAVETAVVPVTGKAADEDKPETADVVQPLPDMEVPDFEPDVSGVEPVAVGFEDQKEPESASHPFDPMALIMAGRQQATDGEETSYDAAPGTRESGDFQEFLCFRVSSEKYAINILDIKEIIKPREITEVPRVPSFISGVLSLRGIIIPVFNMRTRLGLSPVSGQTKERILVIKKNDELCGLMVDEVVQVVRISEATIEQPPAVLDAIDREFVSGIGRYEDMMLILLNLRNILDINLC